MRFISLLTLCIILNGCALKGSGGLFRGVDVVDDSNPVVIGDLNEQSKGDLLCDDVRGCPMRIEARHANLSPAVIDVRLMDAQQRLYVGATDDNGFGWTNIKSAEIVIWQVRFRGEDVPEELSSQWVNVFPGTIYKDGKIFRCILVVTPSTNG